jgi:hypothetical protein
MKYRNRIPELGMTISSFADSNKTLLLIKQQKWLSEFCVKIDRVDSKN